MKTQASKQTQTQTQYKTNLRVALRDKRRAQLVAKDRPHRIAHARPALVPLGVQPQLYPDSQVALLAPLKALEEGGRKKKGKLIYSGKPCRQNK